MRVRQGLLLAGLLTLALAGVALATNIASVKYAPPKIMVIDQPEAGSQEDVVVSKQGDEYSFAQPAGLTKHPDSDPGCDKNTASDYRCPVAGIKKIVLNLRTMDDAAEIDLGSKADKVTQILKGGEGEDTLTGGPGAQREYGEGGGDTLTGGPGPDFIDGGGGTDTCAGGPGHDTIRNCE